MKIKGNTAIVCFSKIFGGMEIDSLKMAQLISNDVSTFFVCRKSSKIFEQKIKLKEKNIKLISINFKFSSSLYLFWSFRQILKKFDIKNIIFFGSSEIKSIYYSTLGLNVNFIMRHGTTLQKDKNDFYHRFLYKGINYHLTISEHLKKNIQDKLPISKSSQIVNIYKSVQLESVKPLSKKNKNIKFLHVGRINRGKGQLEAVKVIDFLLNKNIKCNLDVVGEIEDINYYNEILHFIRNRKINKHIKFHNFHEDITYFYNKSNIFLFPSKGEGFGNVLAEALIFKLPIISFNNTVFPEFLKLGFHINLANDNDIDQLCKLSHKTVLNLKEQERKSAKNYQLATQIFSQKTEKLKILNILT